MSWCVLTSDSLFRFISTCNLKPVLYSFDSSDVTVTGTHHDLVSFWFQLLFLWRGLPERRHFIDVSADIFRLSKVSERLQRRRRSLKQQWRSYSDDHKLGLWEELMLRFETLTNEPSIIHLLLLILIRVGGGWSLSQVHRAYGPWIGDSHRTRVGVQPG